MVYSGGVSATRLILIEGMIGSGKTTTAKEVEGWLLSRGEDARAFYECDEGHPIRTRVEDRLRAAAGGANPVMADDPAVYAVSQWRRLAERCVRGRKTVILEASFLQNSVMPLFIAGAPTGEVTSAFTEIVRQAAPAEPFLVYLRPVDTMSSIARTRQVREPSWTAQNIAFVENSPWARRRNLRGPGTVVALYEEWEATVNLLFDRYPFPKLMLTDPQDNWPAAVTRIGTAIRP